MSAMSSEAEVARPINMKLNVGKAGMETVNVDRVNDIILQASKGSNFFLHKQQRQKQIEAKIEEMKAHLYNCSKEDIDAATNLMDIEAAKLENGRDLSHVIVHIDMDAFFAAVEIRDDPSLNDVPMAVGCQSMLSTSNYLARKFGVRAAMPGFIAKKICPQLVIVEPNFDKYIAASEQVRTILAEYDADLCSMSLDEAGLDITHLVNDKQRLSGENSTETRDEFAQEIVQEIRLRVFEKTGLTCSAGISCNTRLAKICSNINKPNGQFCLPTSVDSIKNFMKTLPVGKVCGIGNVTEQQLNGLGVATCGDLFEQRGLLHLLFSEISSASFLRISLGLGSFIVKSDDPRKSMSVERTFRGTSNLDELKNWCLNLCKLLGKDLKKDGTVGKLVTLKMKTATFQTKTRAKLLTRYTSSAEVIHAAALQLLEQEIKALLPEMLKLRLMGVRMSNLLDESEKPTVQQLTLEDSMANISKKAIINQFKSSDELFTCPICNVVELNAAEITAHVDDCLDQDSSCATTSRNCATTSTSGSPVKSNRDCSYKNEPSVSNVQEIGASGSATHVKWHCPVCNMAQENCDADLMNNHIDNCLSKKAVREVLREDRDSELNGGVKRTLTPKKGSPSTGKRCKFSSNVGIRTIDTFFKT